MITLEWLRAAGVLLNIAELSRSLGYDRTALHTRLRRGAPEITADEAVYIHCKLSEAGLAVLDEPTAPTGASRS